MAARSKSIALKARLLPASVSDSDLSYLIAALGRGQTLKPAEIQPALEELQARRAAAARKPAPVSRRNDIPYVVLRDGQVFAEHRHESQAREHRDYMIVTADGHEYAIVPASEARS